MRSPPPLFELSFRWIIFGNESRVRCSLFVVCLLLLQGLNPNVNALFLLFTLHFILLVGNIESNPGPHELSQSISENNHTDRCISLCNINIRSIRNSETNQELCHYHLFGYQGVFQLQLIYRNHSKRFQGTLFYF
jgi:hypothetical protein